LGLTNPEHDVVELSDKLEIKNPEPGVVDLSDSQKKNNIQI